MCAEAETDRRRPPPACEKPVALVGGGQGSLLQLLLPIEPPHAGPMELPMALPMAVPCTLYPVPMALPRALPMDRALVMAGDDETWPSDG